MGGDWGWMGWTKATVGKGTDWIWVMEESDREFGTPAWLLSLKLEGILHRGNGEGDTSSLEEPGTLGGLRDCSGVDEDLGRRCRMEEKKEQDSGRGMVPIPLSNVRILQPKPITESWLGLFTVDPFSPSALRFTICIFGSPMTSACPCISFRDIPGQGIEMHALTAS